MPSLGQSITTEEHIVASGGDEPHRCPFYKAGFKEEKTNHKYFYFGTLSILGTNDPELERVVLHPNTL
ncbi:uncharacterized protein A4U43_C08F16370 [Asparagus officinalis]|nr:uncharacterized protein A4U43_C08F16370 [Asparagus officinalis]